MFLVVHPKKIHEICKDYLLTNDVFEAVKKNKPYFYRRNLMQIKHVFLLAYIFLLARFFMYYSGDFREGFVLAILGYSLLTVLRLIEWKK